MSLDSYISSNRARAERAYQNAASALNVRSWRSYSGGKLAHHNYQGLIEAHEGYGDPSPKDLSSLNGDFDGQVMMNDGTTGTKGPHWWDSSSSTWKQMDDWSQTI